MKRFAVLHHNGSLNGGKPYVETFDTEEEATYWAVTKAGQPNATNPCVIFEAKTVFKPIRDVEVLDYH